MKQKTYALFAIVMVLLIITIFRMFMFDLSDMDTIQLSDKFCKQLGIDIGSNPRVSGKYFERLKRVLYEKNGNLEISVDIDYENKEVVGFANYKIKEQAFSKYKKSMNGGKPQNWPVFLTESKAKEIALAYAKKIGLPQDVVFSHMSHDKIYSETWIAHWKRMHNGYPYEDGSLSVGIMAIEGEFYSYGKFFRGKPCPTEVIITKEEAIEAGRKKVYNVLIDEKAKKHLQDYVVTSSELKIVQPNAIFGFLAPFHRSNSRLAWVITYVLPASNDPRLAEEVNFAERFEIKIDAATGEVIGGKYNK